MQKRMFYVLGLLMVLFLGSSVVLGGNVDVCPVHSTEGKAILDLRQEEVLTSKGNYSVPRNRVLLEMFGRTT
jgi:hypothetical protein